MNFRESLKHVTI